MANEIVNTFKFKADTRPLEKTNDELKEMNENTGSASKRIDNTGDSLLGMGKSALSGLAGVGAMGVALTKLTGTIFGLGQQTAELKGLGIDPVEFRETEDLFSKLGSNSGDAENFVKKIAEAQNQLSLGKDSAFARSLQEEFGVLIGEGDKVEDVLSRLREATEKQGFTAGQISVKAGELGFSPEFSKVLLATNNQFSEAKNAISDLAKADRDMLMSTEEANQAMKDLTVTMKRLWERVSTGLAPALTAVIDVVSMVFEGWSMLFNLADEKLVPIFETVWQAFYNFDKIISAVGTGIKDFFVESVGAVIEVFDMLVSAFNDHVLPVIQKVVDSFFFIINSIGKAVSKIPFIGDDNEYTPLKSPQLFNSNTNTNNNSTNNSNSSSNNVSTTSNSSNTNISVNGLTTEQYNKLIMATQQKSNNMTVGAF